MFINSKLAKSIRLAMAMGVASSIMVVSGSINAQEESTESADSLNSIEKISVTGSRIRRPGAVSTGPIFSMNAEERCNSGFTWFRYSTYIDFDGWSSYDTIQF